jgi:2'-5' RNA ligase
MGTAIVAIPKQDDYVWNISSEKIPHMTILFLGEQASNPELPHIEEFLGHVINTTLGRFSMTVDHRGVLGADNADVVFFEDDYSKMLKKFRETLLQDPAIFQAYESTPQFEGWTPHLTLGYPATPAKKDTREYPGISWVNFDRIAIWTGDFVGTTFDIPNGDSEVMSMSGAEAAEDVLKHFGVRGMRWGVRTDRTPKAPSSADASRAQDHASIVKKSGTKALSNKELQELVTRMNLEQQYSNLSSNKGRVKKGEKAAKDILKVGKTINEVVTFANSSAGKGIAKALKKAWKAAV